MTDLTAPPWASPVVGFKSRKAAQLCVLFALKAEGMIEKLKLIKLIYFSEREFLSEHHHPMLFDEFYSLPHGPICSNTLNGIDGVIHEDVWGEFVARNGNVIVAMRKFSREDMDEVSDAELDTIEKIWDKFGDMSASQLRNYSHKNCPEYTEIEKGRIPISYREVLETLGNKEAEEIDREISELRRVESALTG